MFHLDFDRIVMVGKINEIVTFVNRTNGLYGTYLIAMQIDNFKSRKFTKIDFVCNFCDVVVGEVELYEINAFAEEIKVLVEKIVAG